MPVLGRRGIFKLDDENGTLTDLSTKLTAVNFTDEGEEIDTTTFSPTGTRKTFLPGWVSGAIELSGLWDATVDAHLTAVLAQDTPLEFEYGPEGDGVGKVRKTGTCVLLAAPTQHSVNGVIAFTARLRINGDYTTDTYPT